MNKAQVSSLALLCTFMVAGCTQPSPARADNQPSSSANFERVSYFKSDGMRGFTYYVSGATKEDIQVFCDEQKEQFSQGRTLKIHFYDDRALTPDVTLRYEFPDSSQSALVADYLYNPNNGTTDLTFHKEL